MKKVFARLLAITMVVALLLSLSVSAMAAGEETLLEKILDPDVGAKPMARLWLPDAGAGYIEEDGTNYLWMVEQYVQEMYDAGMGGVELTMVSDGSDLFYENGALYGWGTDAHVRVLKAFVAAANAMPDGFIIDITITSHWPVVINNVDPNDVEQQQQLHSVYQKITADDLAAAQASGEMALDLPIQRTLTFENNSQMQSPFFFVERLQGSIIGKVTAVNASGQPTSVELSSLADMHAQQGEPIGAAGIPDTITDARTGKTVQLEDGMVVEVLEGWKSYTVRDDLYALNRADCEDTSYGSSNMGTVYYVNPDGSLGDVAYNRESYSGSSSEYGNTIMPIFNMDLWGDAERMNDTQYGYYVDPANITAYLAAQGIDASALDNDEEIKVGDYILINCYSQGSGQVQSGGSGILMNPQYFAVDFFNEDGAGKAIEYWNENMLYWMETEDIAPGYEYAGMNSTLAELLRENARQTDGASCIFEDSIECHFQYSAWSIDALEEYEEHYGDDLAIYMPVICGLGVTGDETGAAQKAKESYQLLLGALYDEEHARTINDWTSTFGYNYRAQPYSLTGLDVTASSIAVNIPEGDNSTVGDGLRTMRASVNMSDKRYLSMESLTFGYESFLEWTPITRQINSDYCDGVNRVIFHGSPFNRAYDGAFGQYNSRYPGWSWGFMAWNARQLWWDYAHGITDYIASVQSLLQNGTAKVEIAVLRDKSRSFMFGSGDSYNALMDHGFSYNIMSEQAFLHENTAANAVAEDGMIYPDGPAYKALIVDNNSYISGAMADKLVQFASAGVPIIFLGDIPTSVYGFESYTGETAHIAEQMAALLAMDNVIQINAKEGADSTSGEASGGSGEMNGATADAVLAFLADHGVEPYAVYTSDGLQDMVQYDEADGTYYYYFFNDASEPVSVDVAVTGEGTVYVVDPWQRNVTQMDNYVEVDGRYAFTIDLEPWDIEIVAVSDDYDVFPAPHAIESYALKELATFSCPDGWDLVLEDHTPVYTKQEVAADTQVDPSLTTVKTGFLGEVSLVTWDQMNLTDEQLRYFGKEDGSRLAGVAFYTKNITLEDAGDLAILSFEKPNATNILQVYVNGEEYDCIDAVSLKLTTDKLVDGENTIVVVVGTGGANIAENVLSSFGPGGGSGEPGPSVGSTGYGLTGFTVTTYVKN